MTLNQVLKHYTNLAIKYQKEIEAVKFLLVELSGFTNSEFYTNLNKTMDEDWLKRIDQLVLLYLESNIPLQHILGYSYFYGYKLKVNDQVLIPRRETEELVEHVLCYYDQYFQDKLVDVVDLGTGSGCIGLTLKKEEPKMNVKCFDISNDALLVAEENAKILDVSVSFGISNWFDKVEGKFDIIVANPPYIPDDEVVEKQVSKEPHLALFGGVSGIDHYITIINQSKSFIKENAIIGFEHGYNQNELLYQAIKKIYPQAIIEQKKDMQEKNRFTFILIGDIFK